MAEEPEVREPEGAEPEPIEPESPGGDTIEEIAKQLGWNPNYDGGDREPLSAKEFILKSREIQNTASKQIKKQSREMLELKNTLGGLEDHYKALYKAQMTHLKREIAQLKKERQEASDDGDHARVRDIDDQLKEMNEIPQEPPASKGGQLHPDFVEWSDENDWYDTDPELRQYADFLGTQPEYRALFNQKGYKGLLTEIEKTVKKMFPQKFNAEPKATQRPAASVESGGRRATPSKTKLKYSDLSRDEQQMCDNFVNRGVMTREKYLEDLQTMRDAERA